MSRKPFWKILPSWKILQLFFSTGSILVIIWGTAVLNQSCYDAIKQNGSKELSLNKQSLNIIEERIGEKHFYVIRSAHYTSDHFSCWVVGSIFALLMFVFQLTLCNKLKRGGIKYAFGAALIHLILVLFANSLARYLNGTVFRPSITAITSTMFHTSVLFGICSLGASEEYTKGDFKNLAIESLQLVFEYYKWLVKGLTALFIVTVLAYGFKMNLKFAATQPMLLKDYFQFYTMAMLIWAGIGYFLGVIGIPLKKLFEMLDVIILK